jgi:hypothetical protein
MDNNLGYIKGNVVSCCGRCNRAKGTMNSDEFLYMVKMISEYQSNWKEHIHDKNDY